MSPEIKWVMDWLENAPTSEAELPVFKVGEDGETLVPVGTRKTTVWDKQAMLAEFYHKFGLWGPAN